MRFAALLALTVLFPVTAYAALININTADAALLDTLPGIGPSKATAIVDYRTQHGSFARIEDIQNVSGVGPSTYDGFKSLITVGDTNTASTTTTTNTASSTPNTPPPGGATIYVPPPAALSVHIDGETFAFLEVPLHLSARVTTKNGSIDPSAQILWSFGDGSSASGNEIEKVYRYAGTYLVTARAADGSIKAQDELVVTVKPAEVRVQVESSDGITIANDSNERLDLSGWRLIADGRPFRIPDGTIILPQADVLFSFTIMNVPVSFNAALLYPDGTIAVQSVLPAPLSQAIAQPSPSVASYEEVQAVESPVVSTDEPIISIRENVPAHEEAVDAPTAATELAAVGAVSTSSAASPSTTRAGGIFKSPWTFGLLGVILAAGGAFIFL